jgi:hypothetical protein
METDGLSNLMDVILQAEESELNMSYSEAYSGERA